MQSFRFIATLVFTVTVACTVSASNFWGRTGGPTNTALQGLSVYTLAANAGDTLYAGTQDGVYSSVDHGATWAVKNSGIEGITIRCLFVTPAKTILAGSDGKGDYTFDGNKWVGEGSVGAGIYRSTDGGATWASVKIPTDHLTLTAFCSTSTCIIAGTRYNGLFRSTDDGKNWAHDSTKALESQWIFSCVATSNGNMFVGTALLDGMYTSTDDGKSWATANYFKNGSNEGTLRVSPFAMIADDSNNIYFAGSTGGGSAEQMCKYSSSGEFSYIQDGITSTEFGAVPQLAIDGSNRLYAAAHAGRVVYRSTDQGTHWQSLYNGLLLVSDMTCITVDHAGRVYTGTTSNGVCATEDNGNNWSCSASGLVGNIGGPPISTIGVIASPNGAVFGRTASHLYRTVNGGAGWKAVSDTGRVRYPDLNSGGFACGGDGTLYASGGDYFNSIFQSKDNGEHWTMTSSDDIRASTLAIDASGHVLAGGDFGLYLSSNQGASWNRCDVDSNSTVDKHITNILSIASDKDNIYCGGEYLFHSTDHGATWKSIGLGQFPNTGDSVARALIIGTNGYVYVGTPFGVMRSTDNGSHWLQSTNGLGDVPVNAFAINDSGYLFAATYGSVFRSSDNGKYWIEINTGLKANVLWSVCVGSDGFLYLGTDSGVYRSEYSSLTDSGVPSRPNSAVATGAAGVMPEMELIVGPNPANGAATLSYELAVDSPVQIVVTNSMGEIVAVPVNNEHQQRGQHAVVVAADRLSAGYYFCRVSAGREISTIGLVVVK